MSRETELFCERCLVDLSRDFDRLLDFSRDLESRSLDRERRLLSGERSRLLRFAGGGCAGFLSSNSLNELNFEETGGVLDRISEKFNRLAGGPSPGGPPETAFTI